MNKILFSLVLTMPYFFFSNSWAQNLERLTYKELYTKLEMLYLQGKFKEGAKYAIVGREKARKEFGKMDSTYAKFTDGLANIYREMGRYKQTVPIQLEALSIFEKVLGKNHPDYARTLNNLALLYHNMGRNKQAETLSLEAVEIAEKVLGDSHPDYAMLLNSLAQIYFMAGNYEQSEPLTLQALGICEKTLGKGHPYYAALLVNYTRLLQYMGRYIEAEPLQLESLKLRAKVLGKNHPSYANCLINLARLYHKMERYSETESLTLEALEIFEKTLGKDHPDYGIPLNNLAVLYSKLERYDESEKLYLETLRLDEKTLGKLHPDYATSLNNLGVLYEQMERYKDAKRCYLQALEIRTKTLGENHPDCARSLNKLAYLHKLNGQKQQSWNYAHQTIRIMSQINLGSKIDSSWARQLLSLQFPSNIHLVEIEKSLSCMYDLLSNENSPENKKAKIILADLTIKIIKRCRDNYFNDQDKLRLLSESHNWMVRSIDLLDFDKGFEQAFGHVEFHKSVLLMEATMAENAYQLGHFPDSLVNQVRLSKKNYDELQSQLLKKLPEREKDSLRVQLNELNLKMAAFKNQIETNFPNYVQFHYQTKQTTTQEVQQNISIDEALIEYVMSDSLLYIFYIDQQKTKALKLQIPSDTLKNRIKGFRHALSDHVISINEQNHFSNLFIDNGFWFYKHLLEPVLDQNMNIKNLTIVPDGELGHLPFEAFLTEKNTISPINYANLPYLIKQYSINYQYSASLWVVNTISPDRTNNGQILAMAAHYDAQLDSSILQLRLPAHNRLRNGLSTLPAAKFEVEALAQNFQGYFGFDSLATEHEFKQRASHYSIIHMAMHGLLNNKFPTLSSLVFSENEDSIENNILQAYEISKMELNADLVVLSACQTGYGKFERGNGVASLARAFMYAGVPSLVVSLWQVDDQATSKIMKEFYNGLAKGLTKSEALRQAKLWYIENAQDAMKHPAYWSPFIQIGNSKPIQIQRKYAYTPWLIGLFCLLAVAGLVFWKRKIIF